MRGLDASFLRGAQIRVIDGTQVTQHARVIVSRRCRRDWRSRFPGSWDVSDAVWIGLQVKVNMRALCLCHLFIFVSRATDVLSVPTCFPLNAELRLCFDARSSTAKTLAQVSTLHKKRHVSILHRVRVATVQRCAVSQHENLRTCMLLDSTSSEYILYCR
jgi:hypothetical protein